MGGVQATYTGDRVVWCLVGLENKSLVVVVPGTGFLHTNVPYTHIGSTGMNPVRRVWGGVPYSVPSARVSKGRHLGEPESV